MTQPASKGLPRSLADLYARVEALENGQGGPVNWNDVQGKPTSFPTTTADISDATSVGIALVTAADEAAGRAAINAAEDTG